jgi:hypothetical protein
MRGQQYDHGTAQDSSYQVERCEFKSLMRMLDGGLSVHVTGGRKLGKSVLLQQVKDRLEERGIEDGPIIVPLFQDLQIFSPRPLAASLCRALSRKVPPAVEGLLQRLNLPGSCKQSPQNGIMIRAPNARNI